MVLYREQLAWAAGFFDGEGHTGNHRARGCLVPVVTIHQHDDPAVLHRFQAAVGLGKVRGPYKGRRGNQVWQYHAGGFEATQAVVAMLWPWLGHVKRTQASAALQEFLNRPSRRGSERVREAARLREAAKRARRLQSAAP